MRRVPWRLTMTENQRAEKDECLPPVPSSGGLRYRVTKYNTSHTIQISIILYPCKMSTKPFLFLH